MRRPDEFEGFALLEGSAHFGVTPLTAVGTEPVVTAVWTVLRKAVHLVVSEVVAPACGGLVLPMVPDVGTMADHRSNLRCF